MEKIDKKTRYYPSFAVAMEIGIISDTHGYMDNRILHHFEGCDLIIHAGDVGDSSVITSLRLVSKVECVYGNIDDQSIRIEFPEWKLLSIAGVNILLIHIAGSIGRYNQKVRSLLAKHSPDVLICGHSHILKIIRDDAYRVLHINPGAAGIHGFHKVRTLIRVKAEDGKLKDLRVVELGPRSTKSINRPD